MEQVAERLISVRLDDAATAALSELVSLGWTQSEAIRLSLVEAAEARHGLRSLAAESRRLMASDDDRREAQAILALMEEIGAPWPDDAPG